MAAVRRPGQPGSLADGRGQAPRGRSGPSRSDAREEADRNGTGPTDRCRPGRRDGVRPARRRRRAALDVHHVPPGVGARSARRAGAEAGRRSAHRRDRAIVSRTYHDDGRANHARQEGPGRGRCAVRSARRRRARRAARFGPRSGVPALQRGIYRDRRLVLGAAGVVQSRRCGWDGCSRRWHRHRPRPSDWSR